MPHFVGQHRDERFVVLKLININFGNSATAAINALLKNTPGLAIIFGYFWLGIACQAVNLFFERPNFLFELFELCFFLFKLLELCLWRAATTVPVLYFLVK